MPDRSPDPNSRLAVGSQPVNRRTRRVPTPDEVERPEVLQQRQQQLRAKHELGRPLAAGARAAQPAAPLPMAARVQAGLGVVSLSGALFVGDAIAIGVLAVVGTASLAWAARAVWRRPRGAVAEETGLPADALEALDGLLVRAAPALPAGATEAVKAIKAALLQAQQPGAMGALAPQDRLFVTQCVARYLPDSLEAYLRLPAARRAEPLGEGQPSGDAVLIEQLLTLQQGLARRLQPLQDEAAEALLRQQRFLQAKSRE
ncbi:MAG: hypothetical protein EKK53_27140 [Burkholderiales bacterium]|nr:MAG: hypothetical protein EKK53_27140 [Burkholderiales bacterium]